MLIAGVDESGRGPLVGPVIAGAVILDPDRPIVGLKDSKKLSESQREKLFEEICAHSLSWAVGRAEVQEIDKMNILQAALLAMKRAVHLLQLKPELVLVDGNKAPSLPYNTRCVIKGDAKIASISAASIVAKVSRDRELIHLDKKFPQYGLKDNKGYPTKRHMEALRIHGPSPIHRRTFRPVQKMYSHLALETND